MSTPFPNEPLMDFAVESNRESMAATLRRLRAQCPGEVRPLIIGGRAVRTPNILDSVDPSNPDFLVGRVCCASAAEADRAVEAAKAAFPAWRRAAVEERAAVLRRVAVGMRRRRFDLAAWIVMECGKPWREADGDVAEAIDFCEFYAREMVRLRERPRQRHYPGEENFLVYEPCGVAAVIAPWNFPLSILTGMTMAALVAGNTVVVKPAEQSPVIAAALFELLAEAGIPGGVANYLPGLGEEAGRRLVERPDVALIAFTGSRAVGLQVIESAARRRPGQRRVKRVIAEMGGKNAIIVDADAELDEAVAGVVASAFGYAGQKCSACSRVIVLESVHEAFLTRLVEATRSLVVGPADDPATFVGPLIDEEARRKVLSYIEKGKSEGTPALLVECAQTKGYFVGPAIFDRVAPDSPLAQEEIFGPVLAVLGADTFDQALEIANRSDYALTGGLYSRGPAHIEQARREFHVGNLYINRKITGATVDRQPFGGFKMSGVGSKAGGPDYLLQFCDPRTITENTMRHGFAPEEKDEAPSSPRQP
ncbi:MAG: L-glutamate gamma-semialdehyde dehydrogenase [Candidatus Sumerlaeota bacterium]|nr:L-glutamate gamma-semialdehyde dehydrogenase [Candidatus Sumerlaeota bacterium]